MENLIKKFNELANKYNSNPTQELVDQLESLRKEALAMVGCKNKTYKQIKSRIDNVKSNFAARQNRENAGVSSTEITEIINEKIKISNNSTDPIELRKIQNELKDIHNKNSRFLGNTMSNKLWKVIDKIAEKAFYYENQERIEKNRAIVVQEEAKLKDALKEAREKSVDGSFVKVEYDGPFNIYTNK